LANLPDPDCGWSQGDPCRVRFPEGLNLTPISNQKLGNYLENRKFFGI